MPPKMDFPSQFNGWLKTISAEEQKNFRREGKDVFCNVCVKSFSFKKRFELTQHIATNTHQNNARLSKGSRQTLVSDKPAGNSFNEELCAAFLAADIPWIKLENPQLKQFMEKHCQRVLPSEWTIRTVGLNANYDKAVDDARTNLKDQRIWVGVDETTDSCGRFIANIIVGALTGNKYRPYLLACKELSVTNNSTVTQLVYDSLQFLWPEKPHAEIGKQFIMFLTDGVPYMLKAGRNLKATYPNLMHVTCLAHGLNRVAETVRDNFEEVNCLISAVKAVFKKAPTRIRAYKEKNPSLPLPPEPVLIRWGTWLRAASFYAEHFSAIKSVVDSFDPTDAACIGRAQLLFNGPFVRAQLGEISANFSFLPSAITKLEERNLKLVDSVNVILETKKQLLNLTSDVGMLALGKLESVLKKNPNFETALNIAHTIEGQGTSADIDPELTKSMLFCPLTTVELERSFSMQKAILSNRRKRFTMENFEKVAVTHFHLSFNQDDDNDSDSME